MGINIRKAKREDIGGMLLVQDECYPKDLHETYDNYESMIDHSENCYVLTDGDIIIGYVMAHLWNDLEKPAKLHVNLGKIDNPCCLFLHDMAISPQYRGNKYGMCLLLRLQQDVADIPYALCAVNGADKYWKKMGFEVVECDQSLLDSYCKDTKYMVARHPVFSAGGTDLPVFLLLIEKI